MFPIWGFLFREWMEDQAHKKETEFQTQFLDSIQALSVALKTGYSVENAIAEAGKNMESQYTKESRIAKEYKRMTREIRMNQPAGTVMEAFSERVRQEDVEDFVSVFASAKKSGGDSIGIIRNAVDVITRKIDTEKEIDTILSAKKLEFKIMSVIPLFLILYMKLTFHSFFHVLYVCTAGRIVMSGCLILYLAAYFLGKRWTRIRV